MAVKRKLYPTTHTEGVNVIKDDPQTQTKKLSLIERITGKTTQPVLQKANFDIKSLKDIKNVSGSPKISRYYYEYMALSRDYVAKFKDFESMLSDPIIQNALEFICDDVTAFSPITKKRIWATAEDQRINDLLDSFIKEQNVNKRIWDDTYKLCLYGNLMFRLRYKNSDFTGGIDSVEYESNTFRYIPIEINNVLVGWIDSLYDVILEPFEVVHFKIGNFRTERVVDDKYYTIKAKFNFGNRKGEEELKNNFVMGSSIFENVRRIWRQIKLIEDNLMLVRLDRSALIRIFKVAVGNLDADDKADLVDYYTELLSIEKDMSISDDVLRQNKAQIGHGSNIVLPVGETGDLTVDEFGGETDVKAMADVDMFNRKFFASLKIPAEFLNMGEQNQGLNIGEGDLKRKEIRYAKTTKKIQFSEMEGWKQISYYHLLSLGENVDFEKFDMVMGITSTAEEEEFKNSLKSSAETIMQFFEFINSVKEMIGDPSINVKYLLNYLTGRIMGMSDLNWDEMFNDFQSPALGGEQQPAAEAMPSGGGEPPQGGEQPQAATGGESAPETGAAAPGEAEQTAFADKNLAYSYRGGDGNVMNSLLRMESRRRDAVISATQRFVHYYESKRILARCEDTGHTPSTV